MKKILIIPSWYPSEGAKSAGIFFLKQAELLSKEFDVKIFIGKEVEIGYRKLIANIGNVVNNSLKETGYYLNVLPKVPVKQFEYVNLAFNTYEKRLQRTEQAYYKYFTESIQPSWKPDLIHAHDVFNGGIVAERIRNATKIPFVVTSHNPINYDKWNSSQIARFKQNLLSADKAITVSNYDKRVILNSIDKDIDPVNLGNYIDDAQFVISKKEPNDESYTRLLYIGSTSRRKDFPTLLKAVCLLKNRQVGFRLTLVINDVPDGITLEDIRKSITEMELDGHVHIKTQASFKELLELYSSTDIFVSSSYFETFGVAVAEAMACGIPVVAADNGGVRDIIENGINGVIVSMHDPEALAGGVLKVIKKQVVFNPQCVRASVVDKFGTIAYLEKLTGVYNSILN